MSCVRWVRLKLGECKRSPVVVLNGSDPRKPDLFFALFDEVDMQTGFILDECVVIFFYAEAVLGICKTWPIGWWRRICHMQHETKLTVCEDL